MQLSNELGLHALILKAAEVILQKPNIESIRTTELINPPIIKNLALKYWDEIVQDISELAWSMSGTSVHKMFEKLRLPGIIQDFGMEATIMGQRITGTLDILDFIAKEILDFKNTSVWKVVYKDYEHFTAQLNIYRRLASEYGIKIDKLSNILILKDWKARDAKNSTGNYPASSIFNLTIPVWSMEQTQKYIEDRINIYRTQPFTICTPKERWEHETFAVMSKGKKKAITGGVKDTYDEAEQFMISCKQPDSYIEKRGGTPLRCLEYCLVNKFCPYGKTLLAKELEK